MKVDVIDALKFGALLTTGGLFLTKDPEVAAGLFIGGGVFLACALWLTHRQDKKVTEALDRQVDTLAAQIDRQADLLRTSASALWQVTTQRDDLQRDLDVVRNLWLKECDALNRRDFDVRRLRAMLRAERRDADRWRDLAVLTVRGLRYLDRKAFNALSRREQRLAALEAQRDEAVQIAEDYADEYEAALAEIRDLRAQLDQAREEADRQAALRFAEQGRHSHQVAELEGVISTQAEVLTYAAGALPMEAAPPIAAPRAPLAPLAPERLARALGSLLGRLRA